ncbi:hypothetical protein ABZP36_013287 [Zizania latifolia]
MGSRVKEEERNERTIRGLLKLPGNRRCINCNSLGPQYVCTSFSTFICVSCSGIHREFTHRVKSISMAKFTSQEVSALQEGGNERGKEIYLKHWDFHGQSLPDSSDVDNLRSFIKNVYVDRRYTGERIGDHPPQVKGSQDDSYRNSNIDSSSGVLRSTYGGTSEDNHGRQNSKGSASEDQSNLNMHQVPARVDQKTGGSSENNQKDMIKSVSSVVEPSKDTNRIALPIRLPDPPRSHKATNYATSAEIQKIRPPRATDPSSKTTTDDKLEIPKSLIDFDSDLEPRQGGAQIKMQKSSSLPDVGWATFDVATPKKVTPPSISSTKSLEGPLVDIPNSTSAPQNGFQIKQNDRSLSFPQANHGHQNQLYLFPADNIQSYNSPLSRVNSAPVNSQLWGAHHMHQYKRAMLFLLIKSQIY